MKTTNKISAKCKKCTIRLNSGGNAAESTTSPGWCVGCERWHARKRSAWISKRSSGTPKAPVDFRTINFQQFSRDCIRFRDGGNSVRRMAKEAGMTARGLTLIIRGETRIPTLETVQSLARVMGKDWEGYYGGG